MTKPIWTWTTVLSPFARGCLRYLVFVLPTALLVLFDLLFRGMHPAYVRVRDFYHYCWPAWFDPVEGDP